MISDGAGFDGSSESPKTFSQDYEYNISADDFNLPISRGARDNRELHPAFPVLHLNLEETTQTPTRTAPEATPTDQPPRTNDQLIQAMGSPVYRTRDGAFRELADRGLCALPDLLAAQNNSDLEVSTRAILLINRLGNSVLPYVVSAANSDDPNVRAQATRSLDRFSLTTLLDYAFDHPEDTGRVLTARPGSRNEMERMVGRLTNDGAPLPTPEAYRAAIVAAEQTGAPMQAFHLCRDLGCLLIRSGDQEAALSAVDRALNHLARGGEGFSILHAVDMQQHLTDVMESEGGQALPASMQQQIRSRIARAEQLRESFQP